MVHKSVDTNINEPFYMDYLKLFAKNDYQLQCMLKTVQQFKDDIRMDFNLDKCAKATFIKGKIIETFHIDPDQ